MVRTNILGLSLALAATASASTVAFRPGGSRPETGVPYDWAVTLAGNDVGIASRHVGAWSWEDNALFDAGAGDPSVGWTHTSDWVQLTLLESTEFTFRLERQANVSGASTASHSMFPSFTIWGGWDTDGIQDHTYNNNNNTGPVWAEDLTYLDHFDNSTESSVERTWSLAAGEYTIVLGSNAPATDPARQGYLATFTTVPEPSTAALAGLALLGLAVRRRR